MLDALFKPIFTVCGICDYWSDHSTDYFINVKIFDYYYSMICTKCFNESRVRVEQHGHILCMHCYNWFCNYRYKLIVRMIPEINHVKKIWASRKRCDERMRKNAESRIELFGVLDDREADTRVSNRIAQEGLLVATFGMDDVVSLIYSFLRWKGCQQGIICRKCGRWDVLGRNEVCNVCFTNIYIPYERQVLHMVWNVFTHPWAGTSRSPMAIQQYFDRNHNALMMDNYYDHTYSFYQPSTPPFTSDEEYDESYEGERFDIEEAVFYHYSL